MVSRMREFIDWRNRLVEKGLEKGIADELVAGLERMFADAEDIHELKRRLERAESTLQAMRVDLARADERLKIAERATADLRSELRAEQRAMRVLR